VFYADGNDLAAKLDYSPGHPKERAELAGDMRAQINASHGVHHLFGQLLEAAHERFKHSGSPSPSKVGAASKQEKVSALLSSVRTWPFWADAWVDNDREKVTVTTSSRAWAMRRKSPFLCRRKAPVDVP